MGTRQKRREERKESKKGKEIEAKRKMRKGYFSRFQVRQ